MSQDTFSIPLVRVKETRRYPELTGRRVRGARDLGEMDAAMQDVKLLLDERGVKLISTFTVATKSIRPPAPRAPYDIVCDGPFLLIVIGNGSAEPLAAAAVETPRWLIPISEPDDVPAAEDPEIQAYSPEIEAFMKQFEQKP